MSSGILIKSIFEGDFTQTGSKVFGKKVKNAKSN